MASCETEPGSSSQKRRRPFITSSSKHDAPLPPPPPTKTHWSHEYDTIRRHHLFEGPPKDHTAYPALQAAVDPHIESFNKIFDEGGLLEHAIEDIGVKTYLDGDARTPLADRNKLKVWFEKAMVGKPLIPDTNKFSHKNREIMPAEARERKCTYRAEFHARITYQINDGPKTTFQRVFGRLPVMVKVCFYTMLGERRLTQFSPNGAILANTRLLNLYGEERKQKNLGDTSLSMALKRSYDCSFSTEGISPWLLQDRASRTVVLHIQSLASLSDPLGQTKLPIRMSYTT